MVHHTGVKKTNRRYISKADRLIGGKTTSYIATGLKRPGDTRNIYLTKKRVKRGARFALFSSETSKQCMSDDLTWLGNSCGDLLGNMSVKVQGS